MNQDTTSRRRLLGKRAAAVILAGTSLLVAGSALAQGQMRGDGADNSGSDKFKAESEPGFFAKSFDYVKHNSYFRIGVLHLQYYGTSSPLRVENAQGLAAQAFGPGKSEIAHTGSSTGNTTTLGGTYGLYLPLTGHHLAMEVTLAPPLKLDFEVSKNAIDESLSPTTKNGIPTGVPPLGRSIGTLKTLPPNFTIVYRPWVDTIIQPYIGVGAMYLYTYDTDVSNTVLNAYGNEPTLNLTKPVACVGQLGADFQLPNNMFITADVKYVGCATVEAKVNNIVVNSPTLSPTVGPIDVGTVSSSNDFKAVLYQFSFGMHF
ncbi:OmpW family outer membrane protein [Salinisphaera aquimarina]|uniref:OmpW family outer membrane protein n=1 Tax=Salinisphaera aquimarina TaxID=2094031 RepID=A0ABV7EJ46_9GAMM